MDGTIPLVYASVQFSWAVREQCVGNQALRVPVRVPGMAGAAGPRLSARVARCAVHRSSRCVSDLQDLRTEGHPQILRRTWKAKGCSARRPEHLEYLSQRYGRILRDGSEELKALPAPAKAPVPEAGEELPRQRGRRKQRKVKNLLGSLPPAQRRPVHP
jgi:hypothetical protein